MRGSIEHRAARVVCFDSRFMRRDLLHRSHWALINVRLIPASAASSQSMILQSMHCEKLSWWLTTTMLLAFPFRSISTTTFGFDQVDALKLITRSIKCCAKFSRGKRFLALFLNFPHFFHSRVALGRRSVHDFVSLLWGQQVLIYSIPRSYRLQHSFH